MGVGLGLRLRSAGAGVREEGGARARVGTCRHDGGSAARSAESALQLAREEELRQLAWAGNIAPTHVTVVCGATARAVACAGRRLQPRRCDRALLAACGGRPCVGCGHSSHPVANSAGTRNSRPAWCNCSGRGSFVLGRGSWVVGRWARGAGRRAWSAGRGAQGVERRAWGAGYGVHRSGQGAGRKAQGAGYGVQRSGQGAGRTCRRRGGRSAGGRPAVSSQGASSSRSRRP